MEVLMKNASRTSAASTECSRATLQWRSRESRSLCNEVRLPEIEREA